MKQQQAGKFWDRLTGRFDKSFKHFIQPQVQRIFQYLKPTDVVLDFGCATGKEFIAIAAKVSAVHGIDISSKMIELARQKAKEKQISNAHFEQTSIFKHQNNTLYDIVVCFNILHFFVNSKQVLQRIRDLLKSGGILTIFTYRGGEKGVSNSFQRLVFSILAKLNLIPCMKFFKSFD